MEDTHNTDIKLNVLAEFSIVWIFNRVRNILRFFHVSIQILFLKSDRRIVYYQLMLHKEFNLQFYQLLKT